MIEEVVCIALCRLLKVYGIIGVNVCEVYQCVYHLSLLAVLLLVTFNDISLCG
jgi:hypothetical protein